MLLKNLFLLSFHVVAFQLGDGSYPPFLTPPAHPSLVSNSVCELLLSDPLWKEFWTFQNLCHLLFRLDSEVFAVWRYYLRCGLSSFADSTEETESPDGSGFSHRSCASAPEAPQGKGSGRGCTVHQEGMAEWISGQIMRSALCTQLYFLISPSQKGLEVAMLLFTLKRRIFFMVKWNKI